MEEDETNTMGGSPWAEDDGSSRNSRSTPRRRAGLAAAAWAGRRRAEAEALPFYGGAGSQGGSTVLARARADRVGPPGSAH
jgi:hypothetical protein